MKQLKNMTVMIKLLLAALTGFCLSATFFVVGIWGGDDRWVQTGGVFLVLSIAMVCAAGIASEW